ncbi:hypothetical protein BGZ76_000769, partial [Entomortierella beljakovae]
SKALANILSEDLENEKNYHQPDSLFYGDMKLDPSWVATLDGLFDPYEPVSKDIQKSTLSKVLYRNMPVILDTIRSKILQDIECQVCFLVFDQPITTYCGHTFCKSCLITSLDYKPNCPLCRHELPPFMYYHNQLPSKSLARFIQYLDSHKVSNISEDNSQERREVDPSLGMTPLFIDSLIFPQMPCYLLVFEHKYRKLLRDVLKTESKYFGMVLPPQQKKKNRAKEEASSWLEPSMEYGTLLKVTSYEPLRDGRVLVETIGVTRFRILKYTMVEGYWAATGIELIYDISIEHEKGLEKAAIESNLALELENYQEAHSLHDNMEQESNNMNRVEQIKRSRSSEDNRLTSAPSSNPDSSTTLPSSSTTPEPDSTSSAEIDMRSLHKLNLDTLTQKQLSKILLAFVTLMQDRLGPLATRRLQREYGNMIEDEGQAFSFWMASILPIHPAQRYELLRVTSVRQRLLKVLYWIKEIEHRRAVDVCTIS